MPTIWVREFTGGLDTRRMPETTPGGVLIQAQDGHITRGGEFEKRAAFDPTYTLTSGQTIGLAYTPTGIYVFGTLSSGSVTVPSGVNYMRLQHPSGLALTRISSWTLFAGKLYVVAVYSDGSIYHFYNGTRVDDWYDGRARAKFTVTGGGITPPVAAVGSFEVTGGSAGVGNEVTSIAINGVSIMSAAVPFNGTNAQTAADVATAINSYTSTPDYTATSIGQTVRITAATTGTAINGKAIVVTPGGTVTVGNIVNMAGGAGTITSQVANITVNGVSIINAPVLWTTSNSDTAAAIASAIQAYTSTPDYDATSTDAQVNLLAGGSGTSPNGRAVVITTANGLTLSTTSTTMEGGSASGSFQPGLFVKTHGTKVYSTSSSNLHFSGIANPTHWTTDAVGAGFIDMSSQASGSEELQAVAPYQGYLAVFARETVQIEYVDPDPTLNKLTQILGNTGTVSGLSVTQFGDSDLFYCSNSGLRSLRARDATTSASTTDIGVPVDELIVDKMRGLTEQQRSNIIGLIEPQDGRFWLIVKDTIFVFSYFNGAKVSAWSIYLPGFDIDYAVVFQRRVYVRSGDVIYVYGGIGSETVYDDTEAVAQIPYQDANTPWERKSWCGFDAAAIGVWTMEALMDPVLPDATEVVGTIDQTTYSLQRLPMLGKSTHISVRLTSKSDGYAKLAALAVHYAGDNPKEIRE